MTSEHDASVTPDDKPPSLEETLEKSQDVKDKLDKCAVDLSTFNAKVKEDIAVDNASQQIEKTLEKSQSVEGEVQECAVELGEVNEALAHEVVGRDKLSTDLRETRQELSATQNTLADTQDILAVAHEATKDATAQLERLHATLDRMGDAVITTDIYGKVTYLNPIAETMTGWSSEEAKGRPLQDVFNIIHMQTKERAPNPIELILQGKTSVDLAPLTVLIQRSESPRVSWRLFGLS